MVQFNAVDKLALGFCCTLVSSGKISMVDKLELGFHCILVSNGKINESQIRIHDDEPRNIDNSIHKKTNF